MVVGCTQVRQPTFGNLDDGVDGELGVEALEHRRWLGSAWSWNNGACDRADGYDRRRRRLAAAAALATELRWQRPVLLRHPTRIAFSEGGGRYQLRRSRARRACRWTSRPGLPSPDRIEAAPSRTQARQGLPAEPRPPLSERLPRVGETPHAVHRFMEDACNLTDDEEPAGGSPPSEAVPRVPVDPLARLNVWVA